MVDRNQNSLGTGPDNLNYSGAGCGWVWLWFWLFLIVLFFAGWGWGGWYGGWGGPWGWWGPRQTAQAPNTPVPQVQQAQPEATAFVGRTVTVSGRVNQVFSPNTFTLAASQGGNDLLVISKDGAKAVKKGETVKVTGKVERYDRQRIHQETGVNISKVPAATFDGKPAVVASAVKEKTAG